MMTKNKHLKYKVDNSEQDISLLFTIVWLLCTPVFKTGGVATFMYAKQVETGFSFGNC